MPTKTLLQIIALVVVATIAAFAAVKGHPPASAAEWLAPISPAVMIAGIGLWIFDRYAWRWPGIYKLVGRPILHGTWHGGLSSNWIDPDTGQRIPADNDVFLVVRQRYSRVTVRLLTRESSSSSMLAELMRGIDGVYQLVHVYVNTPRAEVRHRSALHYGTVVLTAPRNRDDGLEGDYFTGRGTSGELRLTIHFGTLIETHAAGRSLVSARSAGVTREPDAAYHEDS